ncbi:MAG: hypothetical protein V4508_21685 [Pseudomonadota bacterium]
MNKVLTTVLAAATLVSAGVYDKVGQKMYAGNVAVADTAVAMAAAPAPAAVNPVAPVIVAQAASPAIEVASPVARKRLAAAGPRSSAHGPIHVAALNQNGAAGNLMLTGNAVIPDMAAPAPSAAAMPEQPLESALSEVAARLNEQRSKPALPTQPL